MRVGLTGNIGSGKSTVSKIFEVLGVPVFSSDEVGKGLYAKNKVKQQLRQLFPEHDFYPGGQFDKRVLAKVIFTNDEALNLINQLIHPMVEEEFQRWADDLSQHPYLIQESAILFEHGFESRFDAMILVAAPEELRLQRVMRRDGADRESVESRMSHQMEEDAKRKLSDFIIENDGLQMLIPQVMDIHTKLLGR